MTTDPYKALSVQYNHLNLPKLFTWTGGSFNGNSVEVLYDAAGTKLKKTVKTGATVNYTQEYLGGIESPLFQVCFLPKIAVALSSLAKA